MKVRAYISMVEMMRRSRLDAHPDMCLLRREEKLEQADPDREHVVSSVDDGATELKKKTNEEHMNQNRDLNRLANELRKKEN